MYFQHYGLQVVTVDDAVNDNQVKIFSLTRLAALALSVSPLYWPITAKPTNCVHNISAKIFILQELQTSQSGTAALVHNSNSVSHDSLTHRWLWI